ncbi:unnamed protein product, partial [Didymodactylos carnosus]
ALMILGSSMEFEKTRNPAIIECPSDNTELPKLIKDLPDVQEKTKERPFQFPYSLKARALLHSHLQRKFTANNVPLRSMISFRNVFFMLYSVCLI